MPTGAQVKRAYDILMTEDATVQGTWELMKNLGLEEKDITEGRQLEKRISTAVNSGKQPDENDIRQKNEIFSKVANYVAPEETQTTLLGERFDPGAGYKAGSGAIEWAKAAWRRIATNNTIPDDLVLQQKYFQRQGFEARIKDNRVEVRKSDDLQFRPVEPDKISVFDILDLGDDIAKGALGTIATTSRTAGLIGAPATGGASILPGMAGGAIAGAVGEIGQQALGKLVGTREEFDPTRIAKETAINAAIPGVLLGTGTLLRAGGKGVQKIAESVETLKRETPEIIAAGQRMDVPVLPGMVSESEAIQKLTEAQKEGMGILGNNVKGAIKKIYKKIESTTNELLADKSGKSPFEAGSKAAELFEAVITEKTAAAKELYEKANINVFSKAKVDLTDLKKQIVAMKKEFQGSGSALNTIKSFENDLDSISSLNGIKNWRSDVADYVRRQKGGVSGQEIRALEMLESAAKDSYDSNFNNFVAKAQSGQFKTNPQDIIDARAYKAEADKIWSDVYDDLATVIKRPGQPLRGGPDAILEKYFAATPEDKWIRNILKEGDSKRLMEIQQRFPQLLEELRQAKLQEFYKDWMKGEKFNPKNALEDLNNMSKEMKNVMFGPEAEQKINDMIVIYQAVPKGLLNPSKTATAKEWMKSIFTLEPAWSNAASFGRGLILGLSSSSAATQKQILENLGKTAQGKVVIASAFGAKQAASTLLPGEKQPQTTLYPINQE